MSFNKTSSDCVQNCCFSIVIICLSFSIDERRLQFSLASKLALYIANSHPFTNSSRIFLVGVGGLLDLFWSIFLTEEPLQCTWRTVYGVPSWKEGIEAPSQQGGVGVPRLRFNLSRTALGLKGINPVDLVLANKATVVGRPCWRQKPTYVVLHGRTWSV